MKKAIVIGFFWTLLAAGSSAIAGWQSDIATNQNMAMNYISALQVNPNAARPQLIVGEGWLSQRSLAEISAAMSRAEQLAHAGRPDLIVMPQFQYGAEPPRRKQAGY